MEEFRKIESAYRLFNTDTALDSEETHIEPVDRHSEEFRLVKEYADNTHAETHNQYKLEIIKVFKVFRKGENQRFQQFKKLPNRRLLWHGSLIKNVDNILSKGVRIAPSEAPATGSMFGKGIYFADMVSKSANYCGASADNPFGVLLLCEVALGNMKQYRAAENVTKATLPNGVHSVWGQGRTEPDPKQARVLDDGVIVPLGKPVHKTIPTLLNYNEFIVYDKAQVIVKYLLEMKFQYKR